MPPAALLRLALIALLLLLGHSLAAPAAPLLAPATPLMGRELQIRDAVPDIALLDQHGTTAHIHDFHGKALAIAFIYSRCPSAAMCPLLRRNFDTTQALLQRLGLNSHCHLLSITLDGEHDTPEVLSAYAGSCGANPAFWSFASATETELHRLGDGVGLEFKQSEGRIDHNLRTLVIDGAGRLRHVFQGNAWTPQELAAALRSAAR